MSNKRYYLFLDQNEYLNSLKKENKLPFSDNSYFVSGFLTNKKFNDDEVQRNVSSLVGRKSLYYTGNTILEDREPKTNEEFELIDRGGFIITLAGAGYYNDENHSKFEGVWEKPAIKDYLRINPDFTWERNKEIDTDFFLKWNGSYSFSGDLLVFSLSEQSYSGLSFSGISKNYIPHYGLMYGPIDNTRIIEKPEIDKTSGYIKPDKVILSAFLDDSFSDFTNTYKISGIDKRIEDISGSVHNPGGRGELSKYFIYTDNLQSDIKYDVGSWENNGSNTSMKISGITDISGYHVPLAASSGYITESETSGRLYFGGVGGNVIQNTLDLYEKSIHENGFVKIKYSNPVDTLEVFRFLEITTSGVEVLPDEPAVISGNITINKMLVNNETDVYYRILDRDQELDLEKSTLNGKSLSGYNIIYEGSILDEKCSARSLTAKDYNQLSSNIYITELDNHRRKLSFLTPFRSNNENPDNLPNVFRTIKLDLKTTPRKFYFAIARDNQIDEVKINGILFHPDDQDKDGIYRKIKERDANGDAKYDKDNNPVFKQQDYGYYFGDTIEIEVRFKNDNVSLMNELISGYLSDCSVSISKSNNFVQIINLTMPPRDVLLFLKTEPLYTLTVFLDKNVKHIESLEFNGRAYTFSGDHPLPIISHHSWDEIIDITVNFKDGSKYIVLDENKIKNQYGEITVSERKKDKNGYYIGSQYLRFNMPDRDFTLNIYELEYTFKLCFSIDETYNIMDEDGYPKKDENDKFVYNPHGISGIILLEGDEDNKGYNFLNEDDPFDGIKTGKTIIPKTKIKVEIVYEEGEYKTYYGLDRDFVFLQISDYGGSVLYPVKRKGENQTISFTMPSKDLEITLKTLDLLRFTLTLETLGAQAILEDQKERPIKKAIVCYREPDSGNGYSEVNTKVIEFLTSRGTIDFFRNREIKIERGSIVDIFVEFTDIYQHLDKSHFYGQIPDPDIQEAGDFNMTQDRWGNKPIPIIPPELN